MKRSFLTILLIFSIALAAGCGGGPGGSGGNGNNNLPVETRQWLDDGSGYIQFYTNDLDMCDHGYWARYNEPNEVPMNTVVTEVIKVSGNSDYGFGIIFCFEETDTETHYYRLLITTDGYYALGKTVTNKSNNTTVTTTIPDSNNNNPESLLKFVPCDLLKQGYDIINTIKVVQIEPGSFEIYFNSDENPTPAATFSDTSYTGGMYGFYAAVGLPSEEKFPNTPVDVRFKQITPIPNVTSQTSASKSQSIQPGMVWGSEKLR